MVSELIRNTRRDPFEGEVQFMTPQRLADLLGVSKATVLQWAANGDIPAPIRIGRRTLRWTPESIRVWAKAQEQKTCPMS